MAIPYDHGRMGAAGAITGGHVINTLMRIPAIRARVDGSGNSGQGRQQQATGVRHG
jgi:hypothetical protein